MSAGRMYGLFAEGPALLFIYEQGQPQPHICIIYDRIFGDFPVKNDVHIWFWLALYANAHGTQKAPQFLNTHLCCRALLLCLPRHLYTTQGTGIRRGRKKTQAEKSLHVG